MGTLENLAAWQYSREFRKRISSLVKTFPIEEKYRLSDQLIRASRSSVANIAEGYGRFHYQESIQFCRQARGSLIECSEHLYCALDEKYISVEVFNELKDQLSHCIKVINGYIIFLKSQKLGEMDTFSDQDLEYGDNIPPST